jgi:hypothetical protein
MAMSGWHDATHGSALSPVRSGIIASTSLAGTRSPKRMTRHEFKLSFSLIECAGCGGQRVRGVACADCGRRPAGWEVDVKLQRRQAVAEEVLAAARGGNPEPSVGQGRDLEGPLDVPAAVAPWLAGFLGALQEATKCDFRTIESLRASVQELFELRSAMRRLEPKRPFGRPHSLAQQIVAGLGSLIDEYLAAFKAATPLAAQRHAEAGQRVLDNLADRAHELAKWMERQAGLDEASSVAESLAFLIADAAGRAEVDTLLELSRHHEAHLADLLGAEVDPEVALSYALQSSVVELFLDPDEYTSKLKLAVKALATGSDALDRLLSDSNFQTDFRRLELDLFDSAIHCQHAIASARLPRQAAKAVASLHKSLVEAAGRTAAAPLLTAVGAKSKSYSKLRQDNATQLIRLTRDQPALAGLLGGLDTHLRIAEAHSGITYGDNSLTTDVENGSATYAYDDLADATFEAMESCMAVMLAVRQTMSTRGITSDQQTGLAALGLTDQEIVDVSLRAFGTEVLAAQVTAGRLVIDVPDDRPQGISAPLAATLSSVSPDAVGVVELRFPGGQRWEINASAYRDRSPDDDDFLKQVSYVRVQAEWRSAEGNRWLSADAFRKWTAVQAGEALGFELRPKMSRLRVLRQLAVDLDATDVADSLASLMSLVRTQAMEQSASPNEIAALDAIRTWADLKVDVVLV